MDFRLMNRLIVFQSWISVQEKDEKMLSWLTEVEVFRRNSCRIQCIQASFGVEHWIWPLILDVNSYNSQPFQQCQ